MHILGLQGMPRRIDTYPANFGFDFWNLVATIGAFVIAFSVVALPLQRLPQQAQGRSRAVGDPWDGRTLEWSMTSPPPHYNFAEDPVVHSVDDYWHRKYTEDDEGRLVRRDDAPGQPVPDDPEVAAKVHLPSPSYFPLIAALALPVIAYGMIYNAWIVAVGGAVLLIGSIYAWGLEPSAEPDDHHDDHGLEPHGDDDGGAELEPGDRLRTSTPKPRVPTWTPLPTSPAHRLMSPNW